MELILCGLVTTFQTDEVERSGPALESPPVWRMIYLISRPGFISSGSYSSILLETSRRYA